MRCPLKPSCFSRHFILPKQKIATRSGDSLERITGFACVLIVEKCRTQAKKNTDYIVVPRKNAPLVRVNCASVPRELFESEFFGHVRCAFTGAIKDRVGRFELAHAGTLFPDEIGEVPLKLAEGGWEA